MSEGGGDPVNNGDAAGVEESEQTPEVKCPEVNFSPYDEHGRPKPFVCICPPKPMDQPDQNELGSQENSSNGPSNDQPKETTDEPKGTTNGPDKEQTKDEQTKEEQTKEESKIPELSPEEVKSLNKSFSEQFKLFSKFGDTKSDGKLLSLSQSDKWMKQAKVIDGKHITTTDTGIHFKKLKSLKVSETDYKKFLDDLAKTKKTTSIELKKKLTSCGPPGLTSLAVGAKAPSAFDRLTDTSKYTGSHKQRFDESGKGRGIAGRKDLPDNSGYVSGYTNKNTYDKKNPSK